MGLRTSLTGAQTFSHSSLGCHPHFQVECQTGFDITGAPLAWTNLFPNFDNMGMALLVLLIACTCNGYTPYMVRGTQKGPQLPKDAWLPVMVLLPVSTSIQCPLITGYCVAL